MDDQRGQSLELRRDNGADVSENVREWEGVRWYHKVGLRELLGYVLGAGELNIAEVRRVPQEWQEAGDRVIVRMVEEPAPSLPLQRLDDAVAAELVFSLWIRRRDVHPYNRGYVGGLPVFFDHNNALGGEPANWDLADFLSRTGAGGAEEWRVEQAPPTQTLTTTAVRARYDQEPGGVHMISDLAAFLDDFDKWTEHYVGRDLSNVDERIGDILPDDQVLLVADLLRQTQRDLPKAAQSPRASLLATYRPLE